METMWLVLVAIALVIVTAKFISVTKNTTPDGTPPMLSGALPILGHIVEANRDPVGFMQRARKECGTICRINLLGMKVYVVLSRDLIAPFFQYSEANLSFDVLTADAAVVVSEISVAPEFRPRYQIPIIRASNKNYDSLIEKYITEEIDKLPSSGELNLYDWSRSLICQITFLMLIGTTVPANFQKDMLEWETATMKYIAMRRIFPPIVPELLQKKKAIRPRKSIIDTIESTINSLDRSKWTMYLNLAQEIEGITIREIADTVASNGFAAITNSAMAVAEALFRVAMHPELAESFLGDLKSDDANTLAQAWSMECARLSNGIVNPTRVCTGEDTVLGGYNIPKDSLVFLAGDMLSRDPAYFDNPETFDPSRFLLANQLSIPKSNAVVLWGGGQHLCPGKRFAIAEMRCSLKLAVAKLKMTPINVPPMQRGFATTNFTVRESPPIVHYEKK